MDPLPLRSGTRNVHSSPRRSPREHPTSSSNKRGGIIHGKNKFSLLTNDPDEGIGNVGLDAMKHIDHSLVVVQGGGTSDISGTYNKFSTHRDGSYQCSKDGPGQIRRNILRLYARRDNGVFPINSMFSTLMKIALVMNHREVAGQ